MGQIPKQVRFRNRVCGNYGISSTDVPDHSALILAARITLAAPGNEVPKDGSLEAARGSMFFRNAKCRLWPVAPSSATQRSGRFRVKSGHGATTRNWSFLTQAV